MNDRLAVDGLLRAVVAIAIAAGREILDVYMSAYEVAYKEDNSPLTEADRRAHELIVRSLGDLSPGVPVLSEEGRDVPYSERKEWDTFFLVDPIDGTKEFISRNGDFTVNIALIEKCAPVMGVVHVPAAGVTYYAAKGNGSYKQKGDGVAGRISVRDADMDALVAVASRSHPSLGMDDFLKKLNVRETVSRGSALKFCLVAEGSADIYPRLGPTWEWDAGAGHAVVEEAGGRVFDLCGSPLAYNKEILKHSGFIAVGKMAFPREMLKS